MKRTNFEKFMDRICDPLPKELRKNGNESDKVLYYEAQDERYQRHKRLQYRNLAIQAAVAFALGVLIGFVVKVI